jgi:curli biogenesis system outer membrane secretion channel CsgG
MMRRILFVPAIAALALLAACEKEQATTPAATPLEPAAPVMAAAAAPTTNVAAAIGKNAATVCKSYRKKEGLQTPEAAKNADDADLTAQVKAIAAIIADACN